MNWHGLEIPDEFLSNKEKNQEIIDTMRSFITTLKLRSIFQDMKNPNDPIPFPKPSHLWFPKPLFTEYSERQGNAPSDSDRPLHLRGLDLFIDCSVLSKEVIEGIKPNGKLDRLINEEMDYRWFKKRAGKILLI